MSGETASLTSNVPLSSVVPVVAGTNGVLALLRTSTVIALGVVSHWVLDVITHVPDMPIAPWGDTRLGLGLWHSVPGTMATEIVMFAAGAYLYARTTRGRDAIGRYVIWALVGLLLAAYVLTVNAAPPPSITALGWGGLTGVLFPIWAWWGDRHRDVISPVP